MSFRHCASIWAVLISILDQHIRIPFSILISFYLLKQMHFRNFYISFPVATLFAGMLRFILAKFSFFCIIDCDEKIEAKSQLHSFLSESICAIEFISILRENEVKIES